MQVAISKQHVGYRPDACFYTVYLNGEKLDRCVAANEEKGTVILVRDDSSMTRYLAHGDVRIECP